MKRIVLLLSFCIAVGSIGWTQDVKKVAVLKTFSYDSSITTLHGHIVRNSMESTVSEIAGYDVYNSNMLDSVIRQHKGLTLENMSNWHLQEFGEWLGVQNIIVPEAMSDGKVCFIIVKMFDVELGTFVEIHDEWCGVEELSIRKACAKLVEQLLGIKTAPVSMPHDHDSNLVDYLPPLKTYIVGKVSFDMVKVEAGGFFMGCANEQEGGYYDDEVPSHRVDISQTYYIGRYEVTQALYKAVMDTNPSRWQGDDLPVECVSWNQAKEFCKRLSHLTGRRFSLPTEAEWEYAARGGHRSSRAKYCGGALVDKFAWHDGNSGRQTHPVGGLQPNVLGLYDMSGNVWEWCMDRLGPYGKEKQTDPKGAAEGSYRVLRGGSWSSDAKNCRATMRYGATPYTRHESYGFRVVCH